MPRYRVPPGVCGSLDGSMPVIAKNPAQAIDKIKMKFAGHGLNFVARRITIFALQVNSHREWHQVAPDYCARVHRR